MARTRLTVPVWVDEWQHACCGDEFAVGDRVRWTLGPAGTEFLAPLLGPHLPAWTAELPEITTVHVDGWNVSGSVVVAGDGDLSVMLPDADPSSARHRVGLLTEDRHGRFGVHDRPTVGRVHAIHLVVRPTEAAEVELRPLRAAPPPGEAGGHGFLVELDVLTDGGIWI